MTNDKNLTSIYDLASKTCHHIDKNKREIKWLEEVLCKMTRLDAQNFGLEIRKDYQRMYVEFHVRLAHHSEPLCKWNVTGRAQDDTRSIYTKHVDGKLTTAYLERLKSCILKHNFETRTADQAFDEFFNEW